MNLAGVSETSPLRETVAALPVLVGLDLIFGQIPDQLIMAVGHVEFMALYQTIAAGLFGSAAYSADWYGWLGFVIHYAIGLAWYAGYTFVMVATRNRLGTVGGWLALGCTVTIVMQGVLLHGYLRVPIVPAAVALGVATTFIVFSLPVALFVRYRFFAVR